ncbi:oligosaccharide flippase family protein [Fonticella tunisiensis]|uniref:O-antigen/teichoic acid export membrane protein n=1 Tax=Fonticella tunisiensis TaxID=1096341 RepID=A0A4R7KCJ0_9CLOT|nr:oligosaccharide flippase family protein [Fonticella tunisiensis]TDT52019.1 O-antigen/teichoic acid export membrane protein [Fonticella tunisiensis]
MRNLSTVLNSKKIRDFSFTLGANFVSVITGIISAFLVPKYLGINDYAYLRIFTFYLGYVGFFHFGFNDGIYVRYGNYDYIDLPKEKFRSYFYFLLIFQMMISLVFLVTINIFIFDNSRRLIFDFISINLVVLNINTFFEFINQFTRRFKIYSINTILSKILYLSVVVILIIIGKNDYLSFIVSQTIINIIILLLYMLNSKDLIFGKIRNIRSNIKDFRKNFSNGFFVMIGNFMGIIILGLDRFFIDKFFNVSDFAMYSFAVSLLSLFYILLGAVNTVTYPYLARMNKDNMKQIYEIMKFILFVIISFCLSGFFILKFIVLKFIPNYIPALSITMILFPTILFNGQISIVSANFYKTLGLQKEYTLNNIIALLLGFITNFVGYKIYKSPVAIAIASFISFYLWVAYSDYFFKRKIGINLNKLYSIEMVTIILFFVTGIYLKWYAGFIIYLTILTIIIFLNKNELKNIYRAIMSK